MNQWDKDPLKSKLKAEIDSWHSFIQSLRFEDRQFLRDMLSKAWRYADAVENSKEGYTTEAFLVSLLISRQKNINWLEEEISKIRS